MSQPVLSTAGSMVPESSAIKFACIGEDNSLSRHVKAGGERLGCKQHLHHRHTSLSNQLRWQLSLLLLTTLLLRM